MIGTKHRWTYVFEQQTFNRSERRERRLIRELREFFECGARNAECGVDHKTTDYGTTEPPDYRTFCTKAKGLSAVDGKEKGAL